MAQWFDENPKQWLYNGYQNAGESIPIFNTRKVGGSYQSFLKCMRIGTLVSGSGNSVGAAETDCARAACHRLSEAGLLTRQVSSKQRSKGKGKKKNKGAKKSQKSQKSAKGPPPPPSGGHPFVLPFGWPTYNGVKVSAKVRVLANGLVPHLELAQTPALRKILESKWVQAAPAPSPPLPYSTMYSRIRSGKKTTIATFPTRSGMVEMVAPSPPAFDPQLIIQQSQTHNRNMSSWNCQQMLEKRLSLPVSLRKEEVLKTILNQQASVVGGETGSGKTTQVPQFLLDWLLDHPNNGGGRIIVTQPRRLAATSVALRVAQERGERLGESIGYQVRLDSVLPTTPCSVTFCTTGILLRQLSGTQQSLAGVVHIIVDEVHERDLDTDFLLVLLARLVKVAPSLRVTMMSATLDVNLFANYFQQAIRRPVPTLQVAGKVFPVREVYLEQIANYLDITGCEKPRKPEMAFTNNTEESPEISKQLLSNAAMKCGNGTGASFLNGPHCENEEISAAAVAAVVTWLCQTDPLGTSSNENNNSNNTQQAGAILVFLPGTNEIRDVELALQAPPFSLRLANKRVSVLPLHGSLSLEEQQKVFAKPLDGLRKVVLATNVAESSVTIDDVAYVVNTGKVKEKRHDGGSGISSLRSSWASAANNKQRCGRAGRVREGLCVHLFVSERLKKLRSFQLPEMKRVPLEELCLTIHHLGLGRAAPVLAEALEPPDKESVEAALQVLLGLGAVDANEQLTALGKMLAELPLEPRVGKMLVIGRALGVLEPCLTIAASSQSRDPFMRPLAAREAADAARQKLGEEYQSDHITLVNAYESWEAARASGRETGWCQDNFLSWRTLQTISKARQQLANVLTRCGLGGDGNFMWRGRKEVSLTLLRAVIVNSFWPQLALLAGCERTVNREGKWGSRLVLHGRDNWGLKCHPGSNISSLSEQQIGNATLVCYQTKMLTSDLFLSNLTLVTPLTGVVFGTEATCFEAPRSPQVAMLPGGSSSVCLVQENWIANTVAAPSASLLQRLRNAVVGFVEDHIANRVTNELSSKQQQCEEFVECLAEILHGPSSSQSSREGGSGDWVSSRLQNPAPLLSTSGWMNASHQTNHTNVNQSSSNSSSQSHSTVVLQPAHLSSSSVSLLPSAISSNGGTNANAVRQNRFNSLASAEHHALPRVFDPISFQRLNDSKNGEVKNGIRKIDISPRRRSRSRSTKKSRLSPSRSRSRRRRSPRRKRDRLEKSRSRSSSKDSSKRSRSRNSHRDNRKRSRSYSRDRSWSRDKQNRYERKRRLHRRSRSWSSPPNLKRYSKRSRSPSAHSPNRIDRWRPDHADNEQSSSPSHSRSRSKKKSKKNLKKVKKNKDVKSQILEKDKKNTSKKS